MADTAQNKAVVRAYLDALFNNGDLNAIDTYLAEDFVNHDPQFGSPSGREGIRRNATMLRAAFPDWHSEGVHLIAEDDLVVEHFTGGGTHRGEIMGVPSTGRTITFSGISIFRVRDGRIVERWGRLDDLGVLNQLGVVNRP
jgi:steroid delta-isomerase-like uncharacterized protein